MSIAAFIKTFGHLPWNFAHGRLSLKHPKQGDGRGCSTNGSKMNNNQPVSPEIGKIRIKDFSDMSYTADDDKDFHIRTVRDETLIDSAGELDDSHEFALNMFDRGNASDLPDSDRSQNCRTDGINRQTCFDRDR